MQAAELIKYIENPQLMNEESIGRLQKLTGDFPYFQPAHILLSLASKKWDASVYQQSLRRTAIVVSNRSHLFGLLHKFENSLAEAAKPEPVKEEKTETSTAAMQPQPEIKPVQAVEDTRQEIDILKAAELSAEAVKEEAQPEKTDVSRQVEMEMGKQLISSYLEKEILKTPELHNPVKKQEQPSNFTDWLSSMKNPAAPKREVPVNPVAREAAAPENAPPVPDQAQARKQKNKAIIDKIIESSPGLIRVKEDQKFFTAENKAKESLQENEHLVTETLAKIYALQGNVNKAVRAYEILSLKFPQKSAYFATLIQKLKNNK